MSVTLSPQFQTFATQRLAYATGMLLDADDLRTEQAYHRGRLARALAALHGHGTVSGLDVSEDDHDGTLYIKIAPGIALDRLGRVVELLETHCLRLDRWLAQIAEGPNGRDELLDAFTAGEDDPTIGTLTTDVFIAYAECEQGLRPALPQANVDAIDAVVASRQIDTARCSLVLRQEETPALPHTLVDRLGALPDNTTDLQTQLSAFKRGQAWLHDQPGEGLDGGLPHDVEHVVGVHTGSELFLARLLIPFEIPESGEPHRTADALVIDNNPRHLSLSTAELAWAAGLVR